MARLPTAEEIGALPSALSNRLIEQSTDDPVIVEQRLTRALSDQPTQERLLRGLMERYYDDERAVTERVKKEQGLGEDIEPLMAVRQYTTEYRLPNKPLFFRPFNKASDRSILTPEFEEFTVLLERGRKAFPEYTGPIYRSVSGDKRKENPIWSKAEVGKEFDAGNQFQSYSRHDDVAAERAAAGSKIMLVIRRPVDGRLIESISHLPWQGEVLLPRGLRYKIADKYNTEYELKGGRADIRVIELEIIK